MSRRLIWAAAGSALAAGGALVFAALPAGAATQRATATSPGATTVTNASNTVQVGQSSADCDKAPWVDQVQGRPDGFDAGDKGGDYIWHDNTGFHLRVTHKGDDRAVYSGAIHSPTAMRIDPVRLEKGDIARLSADGRTLYFRFADYGHIDGVDFHTDCAPRLRIADLKVGANPLPADRVYLGDTKAHPKAVPFTVRRDR